MAYLSLFKDNVLCFRITLYQPFSPFSMLQVSSSYLHKHKKMDTKKKSVIKKVLCLTGKAHSSATCYGSKVWLSFSITGFSSALVSCEDFNISNNCLAKFLKVLAVCFETNTRQSLWVIGKY